MTKEQHLDTGEQKESVQQMVLEQLAIHLPKMNLDADITSLIKFKSKWIIHLNVLGKTAKLLENIIEENLNDLVFGDACLYTTPKTPYEKHDRNN